MCDEAYTVHFMLFMQCKCYEKMLFANYFNIRWYLISSFPRINKACGLSDHLSTHIDRYLPCN